MVKPKLALTIGDACGIGPELIARVYNGGKIFKYCRPVVIGKAYPLKCAIKLIGACITINKIKEIQEAGFKKDEMDLIEIEEVEIGRITWGKISVPSAKLAIKSVEKGVAMALQGSVQGIVTLPVNKKGLEQAGFSFPGHTEFLAHLTRAREFAMLLIGGKIRVVLVTRHIPLKDVSRAIKMREVLKNIILANEGSKMLGIKNPRIALTGLNPHAGEEGILGREEKKEIVPAVKAARLKGINVSGPYPADSLFYHVNKGKFDMVVAMYHDQGLIPLKMCFFEKSVNVTLGLPIIRTSPGHGTAYDIAGKGIAEEGALLEAVKIAAILAKNKTID